MQICHCVVHAGVIGICRPMCGSTKGQGRRECKRLRLLLHRTVEKVKEVVVHHKVEKLVEVPVEKIVKVSKDGKRLTGAKKVSAPSSRYSGSGVNKASRCDDTCSRISSISGSMAYKKSTTAHDDASTVTSKMARSPPPLPLPPPPPPQLTVHCVHPLMVLRARCGSAVR